MITLTLPSTECLASCKSSTLDTDVAATPQCVADVKNVKIVWSSATDGDKGDGAKDVKHEYSEDGMRHFAFTTGLAIVLISVGIYMLCRARSSTKPVLYQRV